MPMKKNRWTMALCALLLAGNSCMQPAYEEETSKEEVPEQTLPEGKPDMPESLPEETYDLLEWVGDAHKFKIEDDESVRLYDRSEQAGKAQLTAPVLSIRESCWLLRVKLSYNPSANNYTRFYLAASSPNLFHKQLEGYFVQLGGNYDHIYFCRQKGTEIFKLFTGENMLKGSNSSEVDIKVECDKNGYFTIQFIAWTEDGESVQTGVIQDTTIIPNPSCGIRCTYTKSRNKHTLYRWIKVHHRVDSYEKLEPITLSK